MKQQNQSVARREEDVDVATGVAAAEAMRAEKLAKPAEDKDARGPRIPCKLLHFIQAMNIPGGRFEQYLERLDDPKRRQYLIDYLPRMQMYEVTYVPAPGDRGQPEVELYPREFASFRPL